MANLILDRRDQAFVLNELINVEELCGMPSWSDFSRDMFDMVLKEAERLATDVIFPALAPGDREGCRLEDGQVITPPSFRRCFDLYRDGGWINMGVSQEAGGQGFPYVVTLAAKEWFIHNFSFFVYPEPSQAAAHLIEAFGTEEQKKKYMEKMYAGVWGGTMALTEPSAGSDVGNLKCKAIRKPDGTFRLQGTKQFITGGDHDLTENIVHPVLARIEGDPAGTGGISIFLVPKYLVNDDGSLGRRNDYSIGGIEHKMGLHGSSTCVMNFGDNGDCYAELLGGEREGIKVMFQMMNEARIGVGLQSLAAASMAYLHALQYSKERLQGSSLLDMKNPEAPRVPIIQHADVRRMLLWMKSHVSGMRAMLYYTSFCVDMEQGAPSEADREKYKGILEVLTPLCKAYCSDMAFRVTELAIQTYGGYGYCREYPVEQIMRDIKIASIYEGTNGIQALDLVGRKLGQKKGLYFMSLLGEMTATAARYEGHPVLKPLAGELREAVNALADMAMYFAGTLKAGKFMVPIGNAYPFLMMMGKIVMAWFLLWEAGVAAEKLEARGADAADRAALATLAAKDVDVAFYTGKLDDARFFIRHVLPEVGAAVKAIKSEDLSMIDIPEESFAA
jgi:alkylation response protein AidB-like acyl-CoA dehydrogenase